MKQRIQFIFFWISPIAISLLYEVLFADFQSYRWWNVLENFAFAFGMLLTVPLIDSNKIKILLVNFYFVFFVSCLFLETVFFYLFGTNFSASAIFVAIETNAAEAREFIGFYINGAVFAYFFLLVVVSFFYLKLKKTVLFRIRSKKVKILCGFSLVFLLIIMKFSGLIDPNLPYLIGHSVWEYTEEQQKMAKFDIDEPVGNFKNVSHRITEEESLYILIIGESTTRNHLGIYGYYRNTTPSLKKIEQDLLIYQNAISPHAFTIGALQKALTLNNFEQEKESSVVQLMNQAGFKTFWFSNQRPIGPYESLVTKISKASNVVRFTNTAIAGSVTPYDHVLLQYFEEALSDPAKKKFIVLHILGTHMQYKNRFPEEYKVFTERPRSNFEDELAYSRINAYDNAVVYMDDFIGKVIDKTKRQNTSAYVLFFSDHGEEVFENRYFAGHLDANPTQDMFEIPFVLWRSEKFKQKHSIYEGNLAQAFVLDNFIYSLSDLSQIDFSGMKEEKSIFSEKFRPKKRIVGEGIDFDAYFPKN